MSKQVILVAAALVLAPLGARGADLVVWWEEGYYAQEDEAVREIIAAFEQRAPASRSSSPSTRRPSIAGPDRGGARGRTAARLRRTARVSCDYYGMVVRRSARGPDGRRSGPSRTSSIRTRSRWCAAQRRRGPEGRCIALPMGRDDQPRPRLEEPAGAGGVHRSRTFRRSGMRSGRSGATRCSRPCARPRGAMTSGAWGLPCRSRPATPRRNSPSSGKPTRRTG